MDYRVQVRDQEYYFEAKEPFGTDDSFYFAAAITSFDRSPLDIMDPTIGSLRFVAKSWNTNSESDEEQQLQFKEIKQRNC